VCFYSDLSWRWRKLYRKLIWGAPIPHFHEEEENVGKTKELERNSGLFFCILPIRSTPYHGQRVTSIQMISGEWMFQFRKSCSVKNLSGSSLPMMCDLVLKKELLLSISSRYYGSWNMHSKITWQPWSRRILRWTTTWIPRCCQHIYSIGGSIHHSRGCTLSFFLIWIYLGKLQKLELRTLATVAFIGRHDG